MPKNLAIIPAVVAAVAFPFAAASHHSTTAEYDRSKTIQFEAVLDRALLINPHTFFWFDQSLPDGKIQKWDIQWGSPSQLQRQAVALFGSIDWEVGKVYKITAYPHRSVSGNAYMRSVILPNGDEFSCC